jgi:hypothetical protein
MIELVSRDYKVSKGFWIGARFAPPGERVLVAWNVVDLVAAAENPDWPDVTVLGWTMRMGG